MARILWTWNQAMRMVTMLHSELHPIGYEVGLCGSVLKDGESGKDLDIILFPRNKTTAVHPSVVRDCLLNIEGMRQELTMEQVREIWAEKGSTDTKHVEMWSYNNKRIDFFFMS